MKSVENIEDDYTRVLIGSIIFNAGFEWEIFNERLIRCGYVVILFYANGRKSKDYL